MWNRTKTIQPATNAAFNDETLQPHARGTSGVRRPRISWFKEIAQDSWDRYKQPLAGNAEFSPNDLEQLTILRNIARVVEDDRVNMKELRSECWKWLIITKTK